jgi:hypothetical protein
MGLKKNLQQVQRHNHSLQVVLLLCSPHRICLLSGRKVKPKNVGEDEES